MRKEKFNYFKEFKRINRILDMDYSQLYDKYNDLELSHNRMRKLLKMVLDFIESGCVSDMAYLHKRITLELYGLEGYKCLKGVKNEGS